MMIRFLIFFLLGFSWSVQSYAAHPNKKVIITDVLDDDIRALVHILSDAEYASSVEAIVTSTGNSQLKAEVVRRIVFGFGLEIPVFAGTSTDLTASPVTAFAGYYEKEGAPLLNRGEIGTLRSLRAQSGSGADDLFNIFSSLEGGQKLDILCLTAPTDLVKAIQKNIPLSKKVLGDIFAMGFYKQNNEGSLISPYNTMADPGSVVQLLDLYNSGVFDRLVHVPSDTVQLRSGLPGGYLPDDSSELNYKTQLRRVMLSNPNLNLILTAAEEYGMNWRDRAVADFGIGLGTDLDRWVPGTFQNPDDAARFYLADTAPTVLSMMTETELSQLSIKQSFVQAPRLEQIDGNPFEFIQGESEISKRPILDLLEFDGLGAVQSHIDRLSNAPIGEALVNSNTGTPVIRLNNESLLNEAKPLVVVFKNSPDDWFALIKLLASEVGLKSLKYGGIICEGFEVEKMSRNVQAFLKSLNIEGVLVGEGSSYQDGDVSDIPNFKGEIALVEQKQSGRAFVPLLPSATSRKSSKIDANQILDRAVENSNLIGRKVDSIILGEGIDVFRYLERHSARTDSFENFFVMGGGRIDSNTGDMVLSRNWLPNTDEVIQGLENLAGKQKNVFIFSSNEFGGSLVSNTTSTVGNAEVVFSVLREAAENSPAMKSVYEHWINWSRIFTWTIGLKGEGEFNPQAIVDVASISPLSLFITDEWLSYELPMGQSDITTLDVSLSDKLNRTALSSVSNISWLKRSSGQEITRLALDFEVAVDKVVSLGSVGRGAPSSGAIENTAVALQCSKLLAN